MESWCSRTALLVVAALAATACGGGGESATPGPAGGRSSGAPVEVQSLLTQVEPYQPQAASLVQKAMLLPSKPERPQPAVVRLPPPETSALKSAPIAAGAGAPVQIGSARPVADSSDVQRMRGLLQFKPAAGDNAAAAVSFTSTGASGVRLGLRVQELPATALVRGYVQGGDTAFEISARDILAAIGRNRDAGDVSEQGRTYWMPAVDGEEVTLEIVLPPGANPDAVKVSVPVLSHLRVKGRELETLMVGQSASCHVDVTCYPELNTQSRATARMVYVDGGYSYTCTGTLLNDAQSSGTPYFLTAHHCIPTQTAASSLTTYWFYRSSACNARTTSSELRQLFNGATLLYASSATDTSFMRLNEQPPQGATYAGWSTGLLQAGQEVAGVHHPLGDLQKISQGEATGYLNCSVSLTDSYSCRTATTATGTFIGARWRSGTVESGSSGSGLFASTAGGRYLVGQLKGGSASCSQPSGTNTYGRFDIAYSAGLNRWLSPAAGSTPPSNAPIVARVPVHRFYNYATHAHFYTHLAAERDYVLANLSTYAYEGVTFYGYASQVLGSYPVYRLYNRSNRRHFFTMAKDERDGVLAKYPEVTDEGIAWYAQWERGGSASAMHRFYNPGTGSHFYTISEEEKAIVLQVHTSFLYEGVAYHAWMTQ